MIAMLSKDIGIITHAPLFRGGEDHVCESPLGDSCFVINIHNPFMHCVTSQYVFKLRDVIMLMRSVTIVAAYQQRRPPHRYHVASLQMACFTKNQQRNGTNCQFEKYVTTSNYFVLNSLDKSHLNSVCTHYVCDKSENARVCAKWQWNALDWCYWIALPASPVVQSSNTVSCVSLSFRTHPCVLTIETHVFISPNHLNWFCW